MRVVRSASSLGSSIQTAEIDDLAVTDGKLAAAVQAEIDASNQEYTLRTNAFGTAIGQALAGTDTFWPIEGDYGGTATESQVQTPAPRAGTVLGVLVDISANTLAATAAVMTLRAAGVVIASLNLLTAGTGVVPMTITDNAIAAGELLSIAFDVTVNTGGSTTVRAVHTHIRWA